MPPETDQLDFFDSTFMRKLESLAIFSRKAFAGRLRGEQRSNKHGSSVEFADFRPYSQGDDFRRIDWNAFARFDDLFLKLFQEEEDLFVYLLLDRSASMGFGEGQTKFDLARRLAAALAYVSLAHLDRVSIETLARDGEAPLRADSSGEAPDDDGQRRRAARMETHLSFVRGKGSIFSVFEFLRQLSPGGTTDVDQSIREFLAHNRHKGVVIVLSDLLSSTGYEEPLKQLAFAGHQPMVIQITSPAELHTDLSGDFRLVDSETGRPTDISTTRRMLDAYEQRVRRFMGGVEAFCKQTGIACIQTTSDMPFEELILGYFRRAALVK